MSVREGVPEHEGDPLVTPVTLDNDGLGDAGRGLKPMLRVADRRSRHPTHGVSRWRTPSILSSARLLVSTRAVPIALSVALIAGTGRAQIERQFDVRVPMRDGVQLAADLWLPEGAGPHPTVLMRTPYLKTNPVDGLPDIALFYAAHGYAFLVQDVRGRGESGGRFAFFFADAEDGHDTIEWIARQSWSDGKVGMVGGSYLGTVQWLAARARPPHLTCIIPQAAAGRYFDEIPYTGGAFLMEWAIQWIYGTSGRGEQGNTKGIDWDAVYRHRPLLTMDSAMGRVMPLYRDFLSHPTLDDYWGRIQFTADDFRRLDIPALTYTGWFDGDQPGALFYWKGMRRHSPARERQHLIVGPWPHDEAIRGGTLQVGEMRFTGASVVAVDSLNLAFFEHCLKGATPRFAFPRARVYLTGLNAWRDFSEYPPREVEKRPLYLRSDGRANSSAGDGRLAWRPPAQEPPDRYTHDPAHPVPAGVGGDYLAVDLRPLERRDDVLVYTSDILTEPLSILGPVTVHLHAATDGRDTDFMARLADVYPDQRVVNLGPRLGVMRARYREGYHREVPVSPHEPTEYRIDLSHIGHAFAPGHRVRLEIFSSAYPMIHPNPNTGVGIATDTTSRAAAQVVYHDRARDSHVLLPVLVNP